MRITGIRLQNYGPFRGVHELVLESGVYAVTARWEHDGARSNYGGKSTLVGAIPFALFGTLMPAWTREDDWITEGENEGSVTLNLSLPSAGPIVVTRERKRGGPTRVKFQTQTTNLAKDDAQRAIEAALGLSEKDLVETFFVGQKRAAHLLPPTTPGERTAVVSSLFRLGGLDRCVEAVDELAGANAASLSQFRMELGAAQRVVESLSASVRDDDEIAAEIERLQGQIGVVEAELDDLNAWSEHLRRRDELEAVVVEGKRLAKEASTEAVAAAAVAHNQASNRVAETNECVRAAALVRSEKVMLADGRFDGQCPIAKLSCPAKDLINGRRLEASAALVVAERELAAAKAEQAKAVEDRSAASAVHQDLLAKAARLSHLRSRKVELLDSAEVIRKRGLPPPVLPLKQKLAAAQYGLGKSEERLAASRSAGSKLELAEKGRGDLEVAIHRLEEREDHLRLARAVFVRAKTTAAEGALENVVAEANALLGACSSGLQIRASWGREASAGLATVCGKCGAALPPSQKVKACPKCDAPRGAKQIERLDLNVNHRSGGADDLAGTTFQIAAALWTRSDRSSPWSVFVVDEPFGALDSALRRAFSSKLGEMLRGCADQAFLIAHTTDTVDALPRRIEIVAGRSGSKVRVL